MLVSLLKDIWRRPRERAPALPAGVPQADNARDRHNFVQGLMREFFRFAHGTVADNYDHRRYDAEGEDRSRLLDVASHADYLQMFFEHADGFHAAFNLLRDGESRELFRRLVLYRMLGHLHVAIRSDVTWSTEKVYFDSVRQYDRGESHLNVDGIWGRIRHFEEIPAPGGSIALDCWEGNVVATALKNPRQYYFSRGGIDVAPRNGDIVLDCGACFGDTAVYFAKSVGPAGHVYTFDPLPVHRTVIDFNVAQNGLDDRITVVPFAVGEQSVAAAVSQGGAAAGGTTALPGFSMDAGGFDFPVLALDDFVSHEKIERIDYIKMDIEGYELPALKGAAGLIERFRPRLAISLYHRPLDFVEIPLWLGAHFPFYDFYLDHYTIHREETVLYAMAR